MAQKREYRDPDERTPEEIEEERQIMARFAADPRSKRRFEKLMRIAADKGDAEQVAERISWGIDINASSKRGRTPLFRNVSGVCPMASVVELLLKSGADASIMDDRGLTPLDIVRRRLLRYEGKPRKPVRKSPSILSSGDVKLHPEEHEMLDELKMTAPDIADEFELEYLKGRRKAAERVFDTRGELEKILPILESVTR